jgi:hypothetical protein
MKDKTKNIIGLILCLAGIVILILIFPLVKILILIPIVLFVISTFIKNLVWAILLNMLTLLPFIIVYLGLRFPTSNSITFDSKIRYQIVDFGQGDFIRNGIEYSLNNRRIFLADSIIGIKWIYVDNKDFKKLWPEPPFEMKAKNYTIKARFKTYRLLTGDYSKASLISIEKVKGNPMITK